MPMWQSFFTTPDKFAALFIHEAERVYGDRLVSVQNLTDYLKLAKVTCHMMQYLCSMSLSIRMSKTHNTSSLSD